MEGTAEGEPPRHPPLVPTPQRQRVEPRARPKQTHTTTTPPTHPPNKKQQQKTGRTHLSVIPLPPASPRHTRLTAKNQPRRRRANPKSPTPTPPTPTHTHTASSGVRVFSPCHHSPQEPPPSPLKSNRGLQVPVGGPDRGILRGRDRPIPPTKPRHTPQTKLGPPQVPVGGPDAALQLDEMLGYAACWRGHSG